MAECILLHISANKLYPNLKGPGRPIDKTTKKEISKNVLALSMHKVGSTVVFSTDNVIISIMLGLVVLGAYSNYYMIITTITSVFLLLKNALSGSVGNLIASTDSDYSYAKYKQINFIFSFLSTFCTICLVVLFQPFVNLWTGGGVYLLDFSTVILLCISFYLNRMRTSTLIFKETTGIFWYNRFAPIFESVINLVSSIILGLIMGINGIILGTIISTILVPFWVEPFILYKHYFKKNVWDYFKRYLIDILIMLTIGAICYFVCSLIPNGGVWLLLIKFAVCIGLCGTLLIIAYGHTKEFKQLFKPVKQFITRLFKKKSK